MNANYSFLVPYGLYFDHIIGWNNYLDDKNVMFITYEEIQEVRVVFLFCFLKTPNC